MNPPSPLSILYISISSLVNPFVLYILLIICNNKTPVYILRGVLRVLVFLTLFYYLYIPFSLSLANISMVILDKSYSALKPHSSIAAEGSIELGQLSAMACLIGSTL